MRIYKLLFLTLLATFAISCSQDKFEDASIDDSNERLASSQFDNSYLGVYKGLFTTNDGMIRGSVEVRLSPSNGAIAQITLSNGEIFELKSSNVKVTLDNTVENLSFSSVGLSTTEVSMKFSVEGNGLNPNITDVRFNNQESDILIAKNLSRVPLTPITGTYNCDDCASQGIAFPNNRTWNVMSIGSGAQNYMTQVYFSGRVYTSAAENNTQNGCFSFMGYDVCTIEGSTRVLGIDVNWDGTHIYDGSDALACSEVLGVWSAPYGPGISGTFQSDSDCNTSVAVNDSCGNALAISCSDSVAGSTTTATSNDAPTGCDFDLDTANGVWYSFTSDSAQGVTVDTNGSDFDTKLGVFTGNCGALVCVASDDDGGVGLQSQISFNAVSGTTYHIYVTGFGANNGNYNLSVSCGAQFPGFDLDLTCGEFLIDDGEAGDYSVDAMYTYNIDAGVGNTASLTFTQFDIEDGWDFMQIYDGADDTATEITMATGGATADPSGFTGTSLNGDTIVSTGQFLTIVFFSDDFCCVGDGYLAEVVCVAGRSNIGQQKTEMTYQPTQRLNAPVRETTMQRKARLTKGM